MQPGEYNDSALPRPSEEGLFGTIYCERCSFFGLGFDHPEWCRWESLKRRGVVGKHPDVVELGDWAWLQEEL